MSLLPFSKPFLILTVQVVSIIIFNIKKSFFSSASYKVCTLLTHFHFQHHSKNNYMLHFHISLFKVIVEHPLLNFGGRPGIQPFIIKTNLIKYGLLLFFLIHLNQFTSCITLLVESAWFILYIIHLYVS